MNFSNTKIYKYDQDPEKWTKQIEKLTNYKQRKINLESRIKKLEESDDPKDLKELKEEGIDAQMIPWLDENEN